MLRMEYSQYADFSENGKGRNAVCCLAYKALNIKLLLNG